MSQRRVHAGQHGAVLNALLGTLHALRIGAANIAFAASSALVAGLLLLPLLTASPSAASSLTNREQAAVTIKIIEGAERSEHTLDVNQRLDGICLEGCVVDIVGREDSSYVLEGTEDVSLEDGFLFYDGTQDTVPVGETPAQ